MSATPLATSPVSATVTSAAPALEQGRFRLILPRQAVLLGITALLQALATVWVLQPLPFLPYSGMLHSLNLPQMLCGLSLGLGVVFAPFYVDVEARPAPAPTTATTARARPVRHRRWRG